ncbi:MAG: GNAT family N-acetyltransferase [bacterium]|nr:GNAT family N-acetyltransferase [bacterium]
MNNKITIETEAVSSEDSDPPSSPVALGNLTISERKRHELIEEPVSLGSFFVSPINQKIEVVSDIKKCKELWDELSAKETLFDTWEFRYAFYLGYGFTPYFLVLKSPSENLALLPLWYDDEEEKYVWFGSSWQEEVRFFAKDLKYIPSLISAAPSPLFLNAISPESVRPIGNSVKFVPDAAKYILKIKEFKSHEDYLATLKKNGRKDLIKDGRRIQKQNPEIIIDNFADFDQLVALAKKRFGQKGEKTDWEDLRRIETFRQVIKLSGPSYKARMISIKIGEKIAGVDLICLFKNTYFTVKCGYDVAGFSGIGNYMNLIEIDDAIKLNMEKIDFLQNNYAWKSRWFESVPLFKYEK